MDCDLELERGVDKGSLKRGTSRYIDYPFWEMFTVASQTVTGPNRRQQPFTLTSS